MLRTTVELPPADSTVTPDVEARALRRTRDLVRGNCWLRGVRLLALVFTVLSFYRILSHTTFANVPVPIIGSVVCAVITWTIYGLWLNHARKRALRSRGTAAQ